MNAYDFKADAARAALLGKLKTQYEPGPMRPQLCLIDADVRDNPRATKRATDDIRYQWMYYAGMGDADFHPAKPNEARAARELLERGQIVPTFRYDHYGVIAYRPLHLIEDAPWGMREDGDIVLFALSGHPDIPDRVITPDPAFDQAIDEMKKRIEYNSASFDRPFRLRDGTEITPIIFGRERLALRARQNDYTPS